MTKNVIFVAKSNDPMEYLKTDLEDVYLIKPKVFGDERGYFFESFRQDEFEKNIGKVDFVQENQSKSTCGVLRGLHYQEGQYSQAKLVTVLSGKVVDVVVDLRKDSPTFGRHLMVELSEDNHLQLFIPKGFAHGFMVLSEEAVFAYKVDGYYAPNHEVTLRWDDPTVGVKWPLDQLVPQLSAKDKNGLEFDKVPLF